MEPKQTPKEEKNDKPEQLPLPLPKCPVVEQTKEGEVELSRPGLTKKS